MSTNSSNHLVNPAAREAMDKFKMEAASEVGVNLKNGYNGDLTSRQAGSVGGQMVKKMIEAYENGMKYASAYTQDCRRALAFLQFLCDYQLSPSSSSSICPELSSLRATRCACQS